MIARLSKDPEFTYVTSGTALLKFSVATSHYVKGEERASFFDCQLWGKQAESIKDYMAKGKQVGLHGEIRQERYTDNSGQQKSKYVYNVDAVQLLDGGRQNGGQSDGRQDYQRPAQSGGRGYQKPAEFPGPESFDDDIPF